jgi:hypothetical protein
MFYMGGLVDQSSNLPAPVALSSAEAEYNEGCLAFMAASHLSMTINELELQPADNTRSPIPIYFDSASAIAMGSSFRDTKHTRHIARRYHYVRNNVETKRFIMCWITHDLQLADIGTKQTPGPRHTFLSTLILVPIKDMTWSKRGERTMANFEIPNFKISIVNSETISNFKISIAILKLSHCMTFLNFC